MTTAVEVFSITSGVKEVIVGYVSVPTPVIDPPKATELPLMESELFCNCVFVKPVPSPPTVAGKVTVLLEISKVVGSLATVTLLSTILAVVTESSANFAVLTEPSEGVEKTPTPIWYIKFMTDVAAITESKVIVATDNV